MLKARDFVAEEMTMQDKLTVAMLGGDQRQLTVLTELKRRGYTVQSAGLEDDLKHWREVIDTSDIVITGLPMTQDGIHLYAPMYNDTNLTIRTLMEHCRNKLLLCGKLSGEWSARAEALGVECIDYFTGETLQIQNALPSAEGAIFLSMQELPSVLSGTSVGVVGYGRIGKLLSHKLHALDAKVTVYARRAEVMAEARGNGLHALPITHESFCHIKDDTRILFNTVPQCLFHREVLTSFPKNCVYIELASLPGGIDRAAAQELGIPVRLGGGLPGKYAPETAGLYLADAIDELIQRR